MHVCVPRWRQFFGLPLTSSSGCCHFFTADSLEKSAGRLQRSSNVDVTNPPDVNISGTSKTPTSDTGDSTIAKRTRRNAPSLPTLLEIPPMIPDIDEQLMVATSSGDEIMPLSSSNEAMVRSHIVIDRWIDGWTDGQTDRYR